MNHRLAEDLADAGYRVVLLDLPGHGRSDKPHAIALHRMDSYARRVVRLLDELGVERAVVGGVSSAPTSPSSWAWPPRSAWTA